MTSARLPRSDFTGDLAGYTGGRGPDLLLIHGVGLRAEAWGAMLPLLEQHFTIFALDMPGHGGSAPIHKPELRAYRNRFAAFLASRPGPICVAGHSMGAMIAIDLVGPSPEKIKAVAALNAIYQRSAAAASAVQARAAALSRTTAPDPSATLTRWFGANPTGNTARAAKECRKWLTACDPAGYADAYTVFAHGAPSLRPLPCPAMFLTGEHDPNSTPTMSRDMANLCPNGQAIVVKDAAHMAPVTHADMIAQDLIRFFNSKGPSA
ncbi:MAG: pimeloyl-ACP methyl ester carboxylesterase [Paracoccaceae bacterium]|jgi:pimeloyl-ACP methyl ester carboxylesterase